ncbi:MAG: hypothetical protein WC910_05230 [Bacteroidales bacterium]|jgi:hypothetical protein
MTTSEFLTELEKRIKDGRVANIESHLRRTGQTRIAATKELQDPSRWKCEEINGKYGAIYVNIEKE